MFQKFWDQMQQIHVKCIMKMHKSGRLGAYRKMGSRLPGTVQRKSISK